MEDRKNQFRIELTPDQKNQVRHATGKDAEAVELSVEELEERIAPSSLKPKPRQFWVAQAGTSAWARHADRSGPERVRVGRSGAYGFHATA